MIEKIISGGQTGVDRAALDIAIELAIRYGGWCPKGRLDENGKIPDKYSSLKEIDGQFKNDQENYSRRTIKNIQHSDGTLVIVPTIPLSANIQDGTVFTIEKLIKLNKSYLLVNLSTDLHTNIVTIDSWINENRIRILNVAGPRESSCRGVYQASLSFLKSVILSLKEQ